MALKFEKYSSFNNDNSMESPPNSRLFIIGSKLLNEDDYRTAFAEFGNIEEIWNVKDRVTGESKGVTYIKYSKTSEAARAMDTMNGKCIGNINRSIRVMIAASRDQGCKREPNEEEKIQRLFVVVPKSMSDAELHEAFQTYGEIDYATIMRDKETRESKGFGYIKYFRFLHAAVAFEECDRKYRAVFAEPRRPRARHEEAAEGRAAPIANRRASEARPAACTRLVAVVSPQVNQDQLWRLFDIVPGLDYCQLRLEGRPRRGVASVVYSSPQSAAYAREKIHGLEYPPGSRIIVKPDPDGEGEEPRGVSQQSKANIMQIAETIAQASSLIQAAGLSQDFLHAKLGLPGASNEVNCSVPLPHPQPLAPIDHETADRCFIVCTPTPLSNSVLKDIFCRFGNLIDAYLLNNRNCGFAKYSVADSAEEARNILHGAEVNGIRIKVLKAEERVDHTRKRQRIDDKF